MAREREQRVIELVHVVLGGELVSTPDWLLRPGKRECKRRWPVVRRIYHELTNLDLPESMPPRERRKLDAVLKKRGRPARIVEFDETQHFKAYRALTLRYYPRGSEIAFPGAAWIERSEVKKRLEGGGFARPRPPLFPGEGGRHRQRAFRDALADLLPPAHGWLPTLRVADFEVEDWLWTDDAERRMRALLKGRLATSNAN